MKRAVLTLLAIMFLSAAFAATEENIVLHTSTGDIHGLLLVPEQEAPCPVVLIIAGSGPTDMNGNTVGSNYNNNSLKMLFEDMMVNHHKRFTFRRINNNLFNTL